MYGADKNNEQDKQGNKSVGFLPCYIHIFILYLFEYTSNPQKKCNLEKENGVFKGV